MNFLEGIVEGGQVVIGALDGRKIAPGVTMPAEGRKVMVGLRPQNLTLAEQDSPVTIELRERLGGVAYDYLATPTNERIVVETRSNEAIAPGSSVAVEFDPATAMYFDAESGMRLR